MQFIKLHPYARNLTGRRFGRLVAIGPVGTYRFKGGSYVRWLCKCDCDRSTVVVSSSLVGGTTISCGCRRQEIMKTAWKRTYKHGHSRRTPEYRTWSLMKSRCHNPDDKAYFRYGARGIKVCTRWRADFSAFYSDVGPRPSVGHSIDRIDNDGDYEPGNCRWATKKEQANNRRTSAKATLFGKTQTLAQWAKELGIGQSTLSWRVRNNKPLDAPVRKTKRWRKR